jgi:small GTP-binding protein
VVQCRDIPVSVGLWDTAGREDYSRLRPLSYPGTDVFLVCFSVAQRTSFENVTNKWVPEVLHHCPQAQVVIVGTKSDLREDSLTLEQMALRGEQMVTEAEARKVAKKLGAVYAECSAKTQAGLIGVFDTALLLTFRPSVQVNDDLTMTKRGPARQCLLL